MRNPTMHVKQTHFRLSPRSGRAPTAKRVRPGVECLEERVLLSTAYRTLDGSGNNETNPMWGATNAQLLRLTTVEYADGVSEPAGGLDGSGRPNPREISNQVVAQSKSIPNDRFLTSFVFQWGQFLDHDLDLSENANPPEFFNIPVPADDPVLDPSSSIFVLRSVYDPATGTGPGNPRQQINQITSYIDASMVYGSDDARGLGLRTMEAGRLRSQAVSVGEMMPFNDTGMPNAQPPGIPGPFFVAGDIRSNEQPGLTSLHTLFVREHNRLAGLIAQEYPADQLSNPAIDGEIYQRARRIVGAEIQAITYNEFLPALLGPDQLTPYTGYDDSVNAAVANIFSAALYRVGHTMLPPELLRLNDDGTPAAPPVALGDAFFDLSLTMNGGIEHFLKGLSVQQIQEIDNHVVDGVRNLLFDPPAQFDLAAINMQRGRDHGLPDYNQARIDFGLAPAVRFSDIHPDRAVWSALSRAYERDINNIDVWLGGISEKHVPGGSVGELIHTVLIDQFTRSRDGDRFYYENSFSGPELFEIQNTRLADVIRRNTSLTNIQDEIFRDASVLVYRAPAGQGAVDLTVQVGSGGEVQVIDNHDGGVLASRPQSAVTTIVVFATAEDDRIVIDLDDPRLSVPIEVHGGSGTDELEVRGSGRADTMIVMPAEVRVNSRGVFYGNVENITVRAGNGNDMAMMLGDVPATVLMDGGHGNDLLMGGQGADILLGGAGKDMLLGLAGNDLLIGGPGEDMLFGGDDEDILIGGTTAHDGDAEALRDILTVWTSGFSRQQRIDTLTAGLLMSGTISDDQAVDHLFGGLGQDWFPNPFRKDRIL